MKNLLTHPILRRADTNKTTGFTPTPTPASRELVWGFTLIELLVVISIISLLSSIVLSSVNNARAKARDAKRIADLRQIATALEFYYDKFGQYPDNTDSGDIGCWWAWDAGNAVNGSADPFLQPLIAEGFMGATPRETTDIGDIGWGSQCLYRYMRYVNSCTCGATYAVLYAQLETNTGPAQTDERPACFLTCFGEGAVSLRDYAIYLRE